MNETGDRIQCPKCGANNFPSSAVCWQCGEPLSQQQAATPPPGQQPGPQPAPAPRWPEGETAVPPARDNTQTLIILGFVFAALGLCCCPIFAIAGIIMGVIVQQRGNPTGTWVIVASAAMLLVSVVLTIAGLGNYLNMWRSGQIPGVPGQPNPFMPHK